MRRVALFLTLAMTPLPATAQTASPSDQFAEVNVVFEGVVANNATDTIRIRQPDGTLTPWTGPVPDYPLRIGENIRISFDARVPRAAAFAPGGVYAGQLSADGLYRFDLLPPVDDLGNALAGGVTNFRAPVQLPDPSFNGGRTNVGMTLVYNANSDSYAVDFDAQPVRIGTLDGPGMLTTNGSIVNARSTCAGGIGAGCAAFGIGGFTLTGVGAALDGFDIPIFPAITISEDFRELAGQVPTGTFDLRIVGDWRFSAPFLTPPPPTPVPEPAPIALFGMAVMALAWRRRRPAAAS